VDRDGDKIRRLIAERAAARYGTPGHDMRKAKDGEGLEAWTDRQVALGNYYPSGRGGMNEIEIGEAMVVPMSPGEFADRYGGVPPEFGPRWLELRKLRQRPR
jgi:hypothetical protein